MAALGGIAGSENRLISFFHRAKTLVVEAEQNISPLLSIDSIDRIERLHERLAEAVETVCILKERAAELIISEHDLEMNSFHRNMDELCTYLTRLRVYFENMAGDLSENTLHVSAHTCERNFTGMKGQPKI